MGYEVEFLPVGEGGCSGDAIVIRYGNLHASPAQQRVIIIDGGYLETGRLVVEHVKNYYRTKKVDLVISTHPDNDHVGGLGEILTELNVGELWMHRPWNHCEGTAHLYKDGRLTDSGIKQKLRKALSTARDLETLALRRGITINGPFTGRKEDGGHLVVLGPTEEYYDSLLPQFTCTPEAWFQDVLRNMGRGLVQVAKEVYYTARESWERDGIGDNPTPTSAENNSSVVSMFSCDGRHFLLTADAGIPALTQALDSIWSWDLSQLTLVQVPHHGSKHNVGPTLLDRLLGPKLPAPHQKRMAFVSVGKDPSEKHPSRRVLNAFNRRGAPVTHQHGNTIRFNYDSPDRGWSNIPPQPFFTEVEADEAA